MQPQFWTYILTDWKKSVLYTGCTNNISIRLVEHWIGKEGSFTTKFHVHYLVWCESTKYVLNAIDLEKEIKTWSRKRKEELIVSANSDWQFMNEELLGNWPPTVAQMEEVKERWRLEDEQKNSGPLSFRSAVDCLLDRCRNRFLRNDKVAVNCVEKLVSEKKGIGRCL